MSSVLEGVRVIEVASWAYVPSAGATLADWGAEVIKVEPPSGDPIRGLVHAGLGEVDGFHFPWESWNRGKRSVALDLSHAEGRQILRRLVTTADVFLTSFLTPARQKLGIDIAEIRALKPSIVYGCGTAYGPNGPEADRGGFDLMTFGGRGGVSAGLRPHGYPRPVDLPAVAFGDALSGCALAGGVAAGLRRAATTGEGSVVHGSLLGTAMWGMQMGLLAAAVAGSAFGTVDQSATRNALVHSYETSDGLWLTLSMQKDMYWEGLCRAIDREDLITDSRFDSLQQRRANDRELIAELELTFERRPLSHWRTALASQPGTWDVVNSVTDVLSDPQAVQNGFVQYLDYGKGDPKPLVASPLQFEQTPPVLRPAPTFGADTEDVLLGIGMDWDAILAAKVSGAVF